MTSEQLERALSALKADHRLAHMQRGFLNNNYIRAVNFHSTARFDEDRFDRELKWLSEHFAPVTVADVDRFLTTGRWHKDKPGVIPAIFEGFRNHYDVIYPLLEKHGLVGWFYIPAFYPDVPVHEQEAFSEEHELHLTHPEEYPDGRVAMNWDEIREISGHHEICCHSGTHFEIKLDSTDEEMEREIVLSRRNFEMHLEKPVDVFCWLYGEEYAYNPRAARYIQKAGYRFVVGNLKMERVVPHESATRPGECPCS